MSFNIYYGKTISTEQLPLQVPRYLDSMLLHVKKRCMHLPFFLNNSVLSYCHNKFSSHEMKFKKFPIIILLTL
jgi:hypothetical protein